VHLGTPGIVHGLDIDTRHFTGNFPPAASVDACVSDEEIPGADAAWYELLPRTELSADAHHYLQTENDRVLTHLRLNIFPDGGIARLRIYGEVSVDPGIADLQGLIDLFAFENGGRALQCSDEHFGSMHNLNLSGRGANMGDGWETARRRGAGNDWVVLALGCPGVIRKVELDTAHFKGNYPDRAEIRAANVTNAADIAAESEHWPLLLPETKLEADSVHSFADTLHDVGVVSHVRLSIFPDGGVSRLRLIGTVGKEGGN